MKLTREKALIAFTGFARLDEGRDGKPFDFSIDVQMALLQFINAIKDVSNTYNVARQRVNSSLLSRRPLNYKPTEEDKFEEDHAVQAWKIDEQKCILQDIDIKQKIISVKLPKYRFKKEDFKLDVNKIPLSALAQIEPFCEFGEVVTDGDENSFDVTFEDSK